jgi:hypothetical protein
LAGPRNSAKNTNPEPPRRHKALDPLSREQQLGADAMDLAERQLRDGTIAPSIHAYLLKIVSPREALERRSKEAEIAEREAKIQNMQAAEKLEVLMEGAIAAMTEYKGDS